MQHKVKVMYVVEKLKYWQRLILQLNGPNKRNGSLNASICQSTLVYISDALFFPGVVNVGEKLSVMTMTSKCIDARDTILL